MLGALTDLTPTGLGAEVLMSTAKLSNATVSGLTLSGVTLSGVTLSGVTLSGVTLSGVTLSGVMGTATPIPTPTFGCDPEGNGLCQVVLDVTNNETLASAADWLIARPLRIIAIVVLALLLRYVLRRLVDRVVERLASGRRPSGRLPEGRTRNVVEGASPLATARLRQRSEAMGSVLKSVSSFVIFVIAGMMVLSEFGLDLAPLIASAGIAGVALGFGAQNLVKDFLAGVFMIFEDQYGVGDVIDSGQAKGVVEAVGLRVTQLRDGEGVVWYVRNGEVVRIGNSSQGWAKAVVEVTVGARQDLDAVRAALLAVATTMRAEPAWAEVLEGEPVVSAPDPVDTDRVSMSLRVDTRPYDQETVRVELDRRVLRALTERGVDVARPATPLPTA